MGGRGATMISHYKHNDNNPTINMPQEYYEDDPETDIHNRMFNLNRYSQSHVQSFEAIKLVYEKIY